MENLHAGIELFQVRTGDGLKPMYRNGITPVGSREAVGIEVRETIDLCRCEKGKEIRSNAEKLKVEFAKAWEEDGAARQEIRKFIQMYAWTRESGDINERMVSKYIEVVGALAVSWNYIEARCLLNSADYEMHSRAPVCISMSTLWKSALKYEYNQLK